MAKPKIKKYQTGGNFLDKTGQFLGNYGKTMANIATAPLGIHPYDEQDFEGAGSADMKNISKIGGTLTGTTAKVAPMFFPNGGVIKYPEGGNSNAEVEKSEVMRSPDGSTTQVSGPSHENGGVPVSIPNGTQIYSDRLKMPGTKKTFADLASKYKVNKEEKVMDDEKSNNLAKSTAQLKMDLKHRKLSEIFNAQESLKHSKVATYAQKMGVDVSKLGQSENNEFSNGGVSYYTNTPRVHIDAKESNRYYNNGGVMDDMNAPVYKQEPVRNLYSYGGYSIPKGVYASDGVKKYPGGGTVDYKQRDIEKNKKFAEDYYNEIFNNSFKAAGDGNQRNQAYLAHTLRKYIDMPGSDEQKYSGNTYNQFFDGIHNMNKQLRDNRFEYANGGVKEYSPGGLHFNSNPLMFDNSGGIINKGSYVGDNNFSLDKSGDIFSAGNSSYNTPQVPGKSPDYLGMIGQASNLLGPAFNLATNKKPTPFQYNTPQLQKYDPTAEINAAERANTGAVRMAKMNNDGSAAGIQDTLTKMNSGMQRNVGDIVARAGNYNTSQYNALQPTITDIKNRNIDANQANMARYRDINRSAVSNLGENIATNTRGQKAGQMDQYSLDLISKAYPDYQYNQATRQWEHKVTGKKLTT